MITEMMNQELIAENEKLKNDYAILKNNFEFLLKENKELKQLLRESESTSNGEDYYNRLSKYIKD